MQSTPNLVSIIIVNHSGLHFLKDCLESLKKTTYTNFEIILVDNNSTDESKLFVFQNYPDVQIIELDQNLGFSVPNNRAAKIAKGEYLVFLNNDTKVTPEWLSELVFGLESHLDYSIGQSLLVLPDKTIDSSGDYIDEIGRAFSSTLVPKDISPIFSARAACMIVKKSLFLDLGGFDETYFASFEDVEFGWRAWKLGYKSAIFPKSVVYHAGGQTIKKIPDIISFHSLKNNLMLRLTHFGFYASGKSILWMFLILVAKKLFKISLVKDIGKEIMIPKNKIIFDSILWLIKNWRAISKKRNLIKSKQIITNKELKQMGLIKPFQKN